MSFRRIQTRGLPTGRDAIRIMQKMGMNLKEIDNVQEVIIKMLDKNVVIERPNVTVIKMQGQEMYQIAGGMVKEIITQSESTTPEISDEDVNLVIAQTGKSPEEARKALEENDGDLAKAIISLKRNNAI